MDNYLESYIKFCETFYADSTMILVDENLISVFVGSGYTNATKIPKENVVGKHIFASANIPEKNRELSLRSFEKAIKSQKIIGLLIANLYRNNPDIHVLGAYLYPILHPESKKTIALRFEFYQISLSYFYHIIIKSEQNIPYNTLPDNDEWLTRREHQIAFLLFYCKSISEVAKVISVFEQKNISEKTINNIINTYLYKKLGVCNKVSLLQKLEDLGYNKKMPNSLLSNFFIDLSD